MIIRKLETLTNTERDVHSHTWNSRRLLLRDDGMGFSMHDTLMHAGTETAMHYRNHLEAVYCIEGQGELMDLTSGETHRIEPGTLYALDAHDRHVVSAHATLRMICVFNPPVTGREVHDADGAYPADPSTSEGKRYG